jgi:hypothetical protein
MSDMIAVPTDFMADGLPLCPCCNAGRLQPFKVTFGLDIHAGGWNGADFLVGWVAVCQGAQVGRYVEAVQAPCGFTMALTAHTRAPSER